MILKNIVYKRGLSLLPGHWPAEIHSDQLLLVFCFEIGSPELLVQTGFFAIHHR
jgi:hypothetical protein